MFFSRLRPLLLLIIIVALSPVSAATLKIATLSPEGSQWMKLFRSAAEDIKTKTDGQVKIKFYPGGVMGDDQAVLKKMRIRQLHGGAMTGGSLTKFYSDSQVYSVPLRFDNLEQVTYVRESLDSDILQGYEQSGLVTFGLAGGGFAYIMSKQPVSHPDHLKGLKVWAPNTDAATVASFDAFSISPIPLPIGDVLAGLQTGLIDTVATSPVGAITLQWHTQIKYITKVPLVYIYAVLAIDDKAFGRLDASHQQVVRKEFGAAFSTLDTSNREDNEKALQALQAQGIEIITPAPEEMQEWKRLGLIASDNMVKNGALSQEIMQKLEERLASFN
ncbi:MAG: TRAP transporter substrate-binding protein DctP [Aestuariibacter sp.]